VYDSVSQFFEVVDACSLIVYTGFSDKDSVLSDISSLMSVASDETDETAILITISNSDYWYITLDTTFTVSFSYSFTYQTVEEIVTVAEEFSLVYTEPCSVQSSWLVLDSFADIVHNSFLYGADTDTLQTIDFNSTDCSDPCHTLTAE
jgi:hypothetical protein